MRMLARLLAPALLACAKSPTFRRDHRLRPCDAGRIPVYLGAEWRDIVGIRLLVLTATRSDRRYRAPVVHGNR